MAILINTNYSYKCINQRKYTFEEIKNLLNNEETDIFNIQLPAINDSIAVFSLNKNKKFNKLGSEIFDKEIYGDIYIFHISELPLEYQQKYTYEEFEYNIKIYLNSFISPQKKDTTLRVDEVQIIVNDECYLNLDYKNEEHCQIAANIFNEEALNMMDYYKFNGETFLMDDCYLILLNNKKWDIYFKNNTIS